jgi:hypothetical protein
MGPQVWERDVEGPIVSLGAAGQFDDMHTFAPAVAFEYDRFLMWYSGSRGTPGNRVFRLGLASGSDGKQFEKYASNPVLQMADGAHSVLTPALLRGGDGSVLREEGKLRLWFSSATLGKGGLHTLHESTSSDGIHWAEPSGVLMENVYCPSVLKTERGYEMWFSDVSRRPWVIRHATSTDGSRWSVTPQPAIQLSQGWEAEVLTYPTVLKIDGAYLMWYGSYFDAIRRETTAIGFAVSRDGMNWHKHPQNPVLRPKPERPWESNYVGSGCVMRLTDGSFRYWYASRKAPPFLNLYFAINTARWAGPAKTEQLATAAPPEHVKRYLERCEALKTAAIKKQAAQVEFLAAEPNPSAEVQQQLKTARVELALLRKDSAPLAPLRLPPQKDDVGILAAGDERLLHAIEVLEVVNADDAIVRAWYVPGGEKAGGATPDDATFVDLWLHGINTGGLTAQAPAEFNQVFHVTGNKLFGTTCGQRSLPLLEPIDIEQYLGVGAQ